MLCTNSNIPRSICTKLHLFGKSPGLKTSTCQCSVIGIAPPAGSRKFGTYNDFDIFLLYLLFYEHTAHRLLCFLKLTGRSVEPGCEALFIAACSFN